MNYIDDIMKEKVNENCKRNYLLKKELKVIRVKNGIILPANNKCQSKSLWGAGGVLNEKYEYIEESAQKGYKMLDRVYGKYDFKESEIDIQDEKVIYLNFYIHHWGHFLIDFVGRLWYTLKYDISEYKIVYTNKLNENDKILGNYLEFLKLLGINENKLISVNRVTQFKEIIIPETSIYPGKYYTEEYKAIFDTVVNNCMKKIDKNEYKNKKIYCSRRRFKKANRTELR